MQSANEIIADRIIRHQHFIQRFGGGTVNKIIALLNRSDADIVAQLVRRMDRIAERGYDTGPATTKRLKDLLGEIRAINRAAYEDAGKTLTTELQGLAEYEADWTGGVLGKALPDFIKVTQPPVGLVRAAVTSRPFQGRLLKEWLTGLEAAKSARIRDAIRLGLVEGETIDQMVRRIRGTRALKYADGLMEIDRRGAAAMVRTAVNHTVTGAREALYQENADIIGGVQWVSTLDGKTTPICQARDGKVFPLDSGPRPPAHIGCRSGTVPLTKSWREMGIDLDEFNPTTRASLNGQVPADMNYSDWLKTQPAKFQDEILGKGKADLFRSGKVTLDRFVDRAGKELSLEKLAALEAA